MSVADKPAHTEGLFTDTVGKGNRVMLPLPAGLKHPVAVLVATTE